MSVINKEMNVVHTGIVDRVIRTEKVFNSNAGMRRKWDIQFKDGYKGEYLLEPDRSVQDDFIVGQKVNFIVRFNSPKGDIIDITKQESTPGKTLVTSMAGHPAVYAMDFAIKLGTLNAWGYEDTIKRADDMLNWLLSKR
jgi:hypothetical protein